MQHLAPLVGAVRLALDPQPDAPVMEVHVSGSDVALLRSLSGDQVARSYFTAQVLALAAKRNVTRVVIRGGGLYVEVPIVAPNEPYLPRGHEKLIV